MPILRRKIRTIASVLVAALLGWSTPTLAWWDFAKWTMTEQQLREASAGRLEACNPDCRAAISRPTHVIRQIQVVGLTGQAWFSFNASGGLDSTVLTFESQVAFGTLERALLGIYGAPIDKTLSSIKVTMWRDTEKRTTIRLVDFAAKEGQVLSGIFVEYRPIASGL